MPRPRSSSLLRGRTAVLLCAFTAPLGCDVAAPEPAADTDPDDDASSGDHDRGVDVDDASAADRAHDGQTPTTAVAIDHACAAYCSDYQRACPRGDGSDGARDCQDACATWSLGEPDRRGATVACHHALVPDDAGEGFGSCIAAGLGSPICRDDADVGATASAAAI